MRLHRHQVGKARRWHSVRARHDEAWDWCAHQQELGRHLTLRRHPEAALQATRRQLKLEGAH